jgi:hypothetical protein
MEKENYWATSNMYYVWEQKKSLIDFALYFMAIIENL